jgi:hypothetical protein
MVDVLTEFEIDRPRDLGSRVAFVAEDDGRTRMTLRNRGEPAGFTKRVAPLMASAMRRANRKDLARLKSLLEQR